MSRVWIALMMSPDLELWDLAGVHHTREGAQRVCAEDGGNIGWPVKEWVEVSRSGDDQTFLQGFESRPASSGGTFYRVELHPVHP